LVGDFTNSSVKRYDAGTGAFIDAFVPPGSGGLANPQYINFGPDGNLYVTSQSNNSVLRYDGTTGAFIDAFVPSGEGGLSVPDRLEFGPDGNLYVSNRFEASIKRYNGTTGAFIDTFASDGRLGGFTGFTFGPDGNIYAGEYNGHFDVLRFSGQTGALMGIFSKGAGGLVSISGITFGPDGNLYVAGLNSNNVIRYNGTTGAFMDVFVPPAANTHIGANVVFGPDGNLYTTNDSSPTILGYDGTTGAFLGVAASGGGLGADPRGLAFQTPTATPTVSIADTSVKENDFGTTYASFDVTLSAASSFTVTVQFHTAPGTATPGIDYVGKGATLTFLPGQTTRHARVHILNDTGPEVNEQFFVNLSNATNATIADGQAVGTILDTDGGAPAPSRSSGSASAPSLSSSAASALANEPGPLVAGFVVSLPAHSATVATVQHGPPGSLLGHNAVAVQPGQTTRPIYVKVSGSAVAEGDQTFFANLVYATHARIADGQGLGTIRDAW
jgi:sugar lactone lactonase YvrE